MKSITVGIPRAFLYYRYKNLWLNFFKNLNIPVIVSPPTNKKILNLGQQYSIDESCISAKIYLGHIAYLQDKCDYILIPRVSDYGKNEKTCVKFNGQYDLVKNLFPNLKILNYNIEKTKHTSELLSFIKIGKELNKSSISSLKSYQNAKKESLKIEKELIIKQNKLLLSPKLKILVVSHPYNIYDKYIGEPIKKILEELDVELLYADKVDKKTARKYAKNYSPTLYWTYSKELIGSIGYYKDKIDGIIFITSFPCGPDSLVNELIIRKLKDIPMTNILVNESTAEAGLQTRLESFIDIIKEKGGINV
jgi:predicted nucleotide-binding protein (sugar kinase/HSP70/actin superfamily)